MNKILLLVIILMISCGTRMYSKCIYKVYQNGKIINDKHVQYNCLCYINKKCKSYESEGVYFEFIKIEE